MELVRVLAAGGFGIVYLARDHWLDRDVAVKEFLPTHLAGRGDDQQVALRTGADAQSFTQGLHSFIAEAKLLAHFSHPAIVKVHRFWEANGTSYMVMPYLRGPTLGQVRRSMNRPPTEEWLRSIMEPLMGALAMLHAEDVYHRDIAPDNVLLGENGLPVLLDFGSARSIGSEQSRSPTAVLKPRFAPIEQYAEATHLRQGPWTDIYSLGALIAYLLDGVPPPQSTARAIEDEMEPLRSRNIAGVSRTFLSAIDWALGVRPQDRPQSIAELRDALGTSASAARASSGRQLALRDVRVDTGKPFPTTIHLDRPEASRARYARVARPALVALAGMALVIAASPLAPDSLLGPRDRGHIAARPVPAVPMAAVSRDKLEKPERQEKAEPKVATVPSTILTPTTAASTATNEVSVKTTARPGAQNAPRPQATKLKPAPKPASGFSYKPASSYKPSKTAPRAASLQSAAWAPNNQCSGRGFFSRNSCIQQVCKEPKFRSSAQCARVWQQQTRLEHY